MRAHAVHLALFAVGLVVYGAVAFDRLGEPSGSPHFVLQADAWLRGTIAIDRPAGDDWARVETVVLDDAATGPRVRGRRMTSPAKRGRFQLVGGGEIPTSRIVKSEGTAAYMSFPALPAVLMVPQVLIAGRGASDVTFSVVFAAAVLPMLFSVLRRLREAGMSDRSVGDDLWLVALFAFGTVFFFSAVQGSVWYTAHVVGVLFGLAYAWASIEARHPVLAGLAFALAATSRTPMAFMLPLFVLEAWRVAGPDKKAFAVRLARFAAPVVPIAIAAVAYNLYRFDAPTEFGHRFLAVVQQNQIEQYGLFDYRYLTRNLAVAFTLLPELGGDPWIRINGHGLALWFTTPALVLLLWPKARPSAVPIHRALWLTVAAVAIPTLFYQNSGWVQFGYRFGLDWLPFAVLLLAVGGRRFGWGTRALIVFGILVNLFGAVTFDRFGWKYYRMGDSGAASKHARDVVVPH